MREYNWKNEKQSMRGTADSVSPQRISGVPVRNQVVPKALFLLFLLLPLLLAVGGVWLWMGRAENKPTPQMVVERDSANALADVAEKYRHAVGLVVLCLQLQDEKQVVSFPLGTAWAIDKSRFVSNAHVIHGLHESVQQASQELKKLHISGILNEHKVKSEKELAAKLGELQFRNMLKEVDDLISQMLSRAYAEVRINGKKDKKYRISHVQIHQEYKKGKFSPDLGIISVAGEHDTVFKVAGEEKLYGLKSGVPIGFLGFPMESLPKDNVDANDPVASMQTGIIVAVSDPSLKDNGKENNFLIRHNLPSAGGASGSPMFDTEGNVIAVNAAITSIPGTRLPSAALINFGFRIDLLSGMGKTVPIKEFLSGK